jgi:alpha-N-acetylglucosaminidase
MSRLGYAFILCFSLTFSCNEVTPQDGATRAHVVMTRLLGEEQSSLFDFRCVPDSNGNDHYETAVTGNKVQITGSSPVALCRGAYNYLRHTGDAMIAWSGTNLRLADKPLDGYHELVSTPFTYRYYFNVVTHGYTTAYWDWQRWEKEIDWMAIHGINMPLLGAGYEAILYRVFQNLGLGTDEIGAFFTGPAHLPWNRVGNITGVDGPVPTSFWSKQIALTHSILDRLHALGMHPIIQAFAGFVPSQIMRIYPDVKLRELAWGGFGRDCHAHILEPGSPLFITIGGMFIKEWEKEFGKGEFYLADCFNEMEVPLSDDSEKALSELSQFGKSVYESIHSANPEATWVMQGWTFPFHKDRKTGKLFWTPERLHALISEVPDDKLMILDLANW